MTMGNASDNQTDLSRRRLIHGMAATAVVVSTGLLPACEETKNPAVDTQKQKAATAKASPPKCDTTTVDKPAVYPALALWLALTTNSQLLGCDQQTIENSLGLNPGDLNVGWKRMNDTTPFSSTVEAAPKSPSDMYDKMRDDFQKAVGTVYTGGQCPASLNPVIVVSKLPKCTTGPNG
jgi:hypothetical protein